MSADRKQARAADESGKSGGVKRSAPPNTAEAGSGTVRQAARKRGAGDPGNPPLPVSALIELVGVQDVAEEDVDYYVEKTNEFRSKLRKALESKAFRESGIESHLWLDRCYIWGKSPDDVLGFLSYFQSHLLARDYPSFMRAAVMEGMPYENGIFSQTAAILADRLLRFKAVGIEIDPHVRDRCMGNPLIFENCRLVGEGSKQSQIVYWDLAWKEQAIKTDYFKFEKIFSEAQETMLRSRKSAKYFSPFFTNIARNIQPNSHSPTSSERGSSIKPPPATSRRIGQGHDDKPTEEDVLSSFFYHLSSVFGLKMLKEMPGGEMVLYTLIDRMHSVGPPRNGMKTSSNNSEELQNVCDRFFGAFQFYFAGWIYRSKYLSLRLSRDHRLGLPPLCVLSGTSRGEYRKQMATFEEK